jgi:hypothetical protein
MPTIANLFPHLPSVCGEDRWAQDWASPNSMKLASFGLEFSIFCEFLYSVLRMLFDAILGYISSPIPVAGEKMNEDGTPAKDSPDIMRAYCPGAKQVRKTPCRSSSWADFSLLQLYSHRNSWANVHLLGQSNNFLGAGAGIGDAPR